MAARTRILAAAGLVVGGAVGASRLRQWLLRRPVPPQRDSLTVKGLMSPVDIRIDRWGVPHVYASTAADACFGQGYMHARDRRWQMELNRRIASGTLSELFGLVTIEADRFFRRLGFDRAAQQDLVRLDDESRAYLDAYTAGVNAYTERHPRPLEFAILRARPRPWRATDSLAFGRYMSWTQTANFETELIRARLLTKLSPERVAALEPGDPAAHVPTAYGVKHRELLESAKAFAPLSGLAGGASNNWVVSASHSATGRPLLANDPHLFPRMPAVWYVIHLMGGDLDVAGASLPGITGVVIGHNARISWGVTAGMTDGEDLYLERRDGSERVIKEMITVRGRAPILDEVVETKHGPLLNGSLDIPAEGPQIALRSVLSDWPSPAVALLRLNRANDWTTFREALKEWAFPSLNFVYADVDGNIGYQLAGRVPVRAGGDGYAPVPGWSSDYEWTGYVAYDDMPRVLNPPDGFFATANSRPNVHSTQFLARDWCDDSRWRRIIELLESRPRHSIDDFRAMQGDVVSLPAKEIVAAVRSELGNRSPNGSTATALNALERWDGALSPSSIAATVYNAFRNELINIVNSDLQPNLLGYTQGKGLDPVVAPVSAFYFKGSSILLGHLQKVEAATIRMALDAALADLRRRFGDDPAGWQWGRAHSITFAHPLGLGAPMLDRLFHLSRGPLPIGGDADTVAQAGVDPWQPYRANAFSVSYRQIFDVGNWDAALFILPTGQSGHPGSPHYDDMVEPWRTVDYRPLLFSRSAVDRETTEQVSLQPS